MRQGNLTDAPQDGAAGAVDEAAALQNAAHALLSERPGVRISEIRTGFGTATVFMHGLITRPAEDDVPDRELTVAMLRAALGERIYSGSW